MQREHERARGRGARKKSAGGTAEDAGAIAGEKFATGAGELAGESGGNAGVAGAEGMGVFRVNPVELDTAALDAEADRLLHDSPPELTGEAPAPAGQAGELVSSNGLGSWNEVTPGLVAAADVLILPQWQLRDDEKKNLAGALGDVLDQIFPGGMSDARWAPYVRLVAVSIAIVAVRRDPKTGSLPPLGPMKRAEKPDAADAAGAADRKAA